MCVCVCVRVLKSPNHTRYILKDIDLLHPVRSTIRTATPKASDSEDISSVSSRIPRTGCKSSLSCVVTIPEVRCVAEWANRLRRVRFFFFFHVLPSRLRGDPRCLLGSTWKKKKNLRTSIRIFHHKGFNRCFHSG